MIKIIDKNILESTEDILCQQVNCRGTMGKGLGLSLRIHFPEVYYTYLIHCQKNKYSKYMLGTVQYVTTRRNIVANMFSQYEYGTSKCYTDYNAMRKCFTEINKLNKSVAIPYGIGCGLAGGEWHIVYNIINEIFGGRDDVTIYRYENN